MLAIMLLASLCFTLFLFSYLIINLYAQKGMHRITNKIKHLIENHQKAENSLYKLKLEMQVQELKDEALKMSELPTKYKFYIGFPGILFSTLSIAVMILFFIINDRYDVVSELISILKDADVEKIDVDKLNQLQEIQSKIGGLNSAIGWCSVISQYLLLSLVIADVFKLPHKEDYLREIIQAINEGLEK